jgi:predicted SnoaL-like aldol condensation-catalyzing enzyme
MTEIAARHKAAIVEALTSAFTKRDFAALERWFAPEYVQHNPFIPGTRDGLRAYIASLPPDRRYEPGMVLAEGEFVMIHGRYSGGEGRKTFVAADIFRFENDRVVEHWDVLQEEVPAEQTVAGNAMFTIAESYRGA